MCLSSPGKVAKASSRGYDRGARAGEPVIQVLLNPLWDVSSHPIDQSKSPGRAQSQNVGQNVLPRVACRLPRPKEYLRVR